MDYAALRTEIRTGPHAATMAAHVTNGNDVAIAAFLNDRNAAGAAAITLNTIPRQRVLRVFLKVAIDLDGKTAAMKARWDRILPFISGMDDTPVGVLNDALDLAIADGLLLPAKADSIRQRNGSRCEVLWGEGESVTPFDVARALRDASGTLII